jgi:hypothetical protein
MMMDIYVPSKMDTIQYLTRTCNTCQAEKLQNDFYCYSGRKWLHGDCKDCDRDKRSSTRVKKGAGFAKITADVRAEIQRKYAMKIPLKVIATDYGITYANLCYWKRCGNLEA